MVDRRVTNPTPSGELRNQYAKAGSEFERRAVCLRAIDEGVLRTYQPVATIDELFGTGAAAHLPTKKEYSASGMVKFAIPDSNGLRESTGVRKAKGWYLRFTYFDDGTIEDYYLSNGPEPRPL